MAIATAAAALNFWNPAGWVFAAVSVSGGLLASIFGWAGRKAERKAEATRNKARREALTSARQSVDDTFDTFIERVADAAASQGRNTMTAVLCPPLREAVAVRLVLTAAAEARSHLDRLNKSLPYHEPQLILHDAAKRIEQRLRPSDPRAAQLIWLGEDWIDDPEGLLATSGASTPVRTKPPGLAQRLFATVRDAFASVTDHPKSGDGTEWLRRAHATLCEVPLAAEALNELDRIAKGDRPRLHLIGDYNTGKTSFVRRLLIDAGEALPERIEIRGDPTTSGVVEFEWDGVLLVDSPGLQSTRAADTAVSLRALSDACHVICLLQPNLLGSSLDLLALILKGDDSAGLAPKLARAVLVINRADELGVDPSEDPEEYGRLCVRKKAELVQALARRGITVPTSRIVCVASDPYGLVGDRRDVNARQYDPFREWDGFSQFGRIVHSLKAQASRIGVDVSLLEGGAARMAEVRRQTRTDVETASEKLTVLGRIKDSLGDAEEEGQRIRANIDARLDAMLDEITEGYLSDAMGAITESELHEVATALARWWEDASFLAQVDRWQNESRRNIERWFTRTQAEVGRCMSSPAFFQAFPEVKQAFDASRLKPRGGGHRSWWDFVETTVRSGGTRDVVYDVGKFFRYDFRPWEAVKTGAKIAKVGAVLAAVGVGLDAIDWAMSAKAANKREEARRDAAKFLRDSRDAIRDSLLGGEAAVLGPGAYLAEHASELARMLNELHESFLGEKRAHKALETQVRLLNEVISDARARLGLPEEERA